jgi:hypothetical protein
MAYEQVYGPLLVHDRVDIGFAMCAYVMAALWSKGRHKPQDFLPPWLKELTKPERSDAAVIAAFEAMLKDAEGGSDADQGSTERGAMPQRPR